MKKNLIKKARVAVGGIMHETNTFARTRTDYRDFQSGRAIGAAEGTALLTQFRNVQVVGLGAWRSLGGAWGQVSIFNKLIDKRG